MTTAKEKRYRLSLSWEHEKEEEWLNARSAEGLHFKKLSLVKYTFDRDPSVRYTYRLDYQGGFGKTMSKEEYIELYRDAGWEYVSSYGAMWHYFRRPYEEGEEAQLLYTDSESLAGLYKRVQAMIAVMFFMNLFFMVFNTIRGGVLGYSLLVLYVFLFAVLGTGYFRLGKKIKRISK
ncbi:DUF2812 domain-containing protein [Cohnella fermenti]|uniref:DUF2812 domain-containing protein n=1 Tax=Cohnella fermenti TaxID=2565925 RepID=A0A4S4C6Y1_9BACL|nr:DUF2812 domain-containing protein [Cohnella fermenti]THF83688.1 DUF2812 domain-containing protein [Cohnella fermenti]